MGKLLIKSSQQLCTDKDTDMFNRPQSPGPSHLMLRAPTSTSDQPRFSTGPQPRESSSTEPSQTPGPLMPTDPETIYGGMNEYEREDWETDLWGQQALRYELDDQRDS